MITGAPPRGKSEAPGHAALGLAIDRGAGVNCARNRPPRVVAFFSHSRRAGGATQELRELVRRYQQGRTNAATLAN